MKRFLGVLVVGLFAAAVGRADLLPPGTKNIPINHKIETEKEYPDWVFFVVHGSGGVTPVKLAPKTPIEIPGSSGIGNGPVPRPGQKERTIPYRASAVVAVAKDAAKDYKSEKEFHAAIEDGKVAGMLPINGHFSDHENVKVTDPRKSIDRRYLITKIDAKGGVTLEPIKNQGKQEEEEQAAATPRLFPWIASGLAAAGGIGFIGLWLARLRGPRPT